MKMLIVDDESKVRQTLKSGFSEIGFKVDDASNGEEALDLIHNVTFDIVICDVIMPKMSGMALVYELRMTGNPIPLILLTAMGHTDDKIRGLELGADDYIEKPFDFFELVARVNALIRRSSQKFEAKVLSYADLQLDLDAKSASRLGQPLNLTPKEFALISYFISNKERVISKAEIAEKVWDITFDTNTNIIEVYVSYLRNKVDKPFKSSLIHTCHGMGYIMKSK